MTESSDQQEQRTAMGRRTVMRGAAWSVPVIAFAAASPARAASGDECPCFTPTTFGPVVTISGTNITGGQGRLTYNAGLGVDATTCAHVSQTYRGTVLDMTLTMSDTRTYAGALVSGTTTNNAFFDPNGAVPANFEFNGVKFPDGDYLVLGGQTSTPPVHPVAATATMRFEWDDHVCVKTLDYRFVTDAFSTGSNGAVSGGSAPLGVNFTRRVVPA